MTLKRKYERYSLSKKLREENKSNDYLELMLTNLTLEELIGLKLECTYRSLNVELYGLPLYLSLSSIVKDALVRFVFSYTSSSNEAKRLLGLSSKRLKEIKDRGNY